MDPGTKTLCGEIVHFDCRHFVGDRPCAPHKQKGVKCADCPDYAPTSRRILIVKLGAMGDVLRTTSILPSLKRRYGAPYITWLTEADSIDLLRQNPLIDCLMPLDGASAARLQTEAFDLVIAPEAARQSAALATLARAKEKKGFGLDPAGTVFAFNSGAQEIFLMGLFDDVKKRNRKTYEELICQLAELPFERHRPILHLTEEEGRFGAEFKKARHIDPACTIIGLNTGGGGRWRMKRWTVDGFKGLARRLSQRDDLKVLLLGGPAEAPLNRQILSEPQVRAIDGGCFNSTRHFAALIGICDVLVTGDSLALHLALALQKRIVALFGPTSHTEIDLYDSGQKLFADMDCLCCYLPDCDKKPKCMDNLSIETVYRAVAEQLRILGR
jgi:ADP-heptose:LPS heptosyltransferase